MGAFSDLAADIRHLSPSHRDCRKLGLVFLIALGIIGGLLLWRSGAAGWWVLGAGGLLGLWGLAWPAGYKPIYLAWMALALVLGFIMSRVLLTLLFYLALTPIGLIRRLMGKRPLDLNLADRDSYWYPREEPYDPQSSEKMY